MLNLVFHTSSPSVPVAGAAMAWARESRLLRRYNTEWTPDLLDRAPWLAAADLLGLLITLLLSLLLVG